MAEVVVEVGAVVCEGAVVRATGGGRGGFTTGAGASSEAGAGAGAGTETAAGVETGSGAAAGVDALATSDSSSSDLIGLSFFSKSARAPDGSMLIPI